MKTQILSILTSGNSNLESIVRNKMETKMWYTIPWKQNDPVKLELEMRENE